jgi:hypothetical protein
MLKSVSSASSGSSIIIRTGTLTRVTYSSITYIDSARGIRFSSLRKLLFLFGRLLLLVTFIAIVNLGAYIGILLKRNTGVVVRNY